MAKYLEKYEHPNYYKLATCEELAELNLNLKEIIKLKKIEIKLSLTTSLNHDQMEEILQDLN